MLLPDLQHLAERAISSWDLTRYDTSALQKASKACALLGRPGFYVYLSMLRWCSYCQKYLGETAPLEDYRVSHGICQACEAVLEINCKVAGSYDPVVAACLILEFHWARAGQFWLQLEGQNWLQFYKYGV